MRCRWFLTLLLAAGSAGPAMAGPAPDVADDLEEALAALDAADGMVTADDLAADDPPGWRWPTGSWRLAIRCREGGRRDLESRLELRSGDLRLAGRWRRRDGENALAGWLLVGETDLVVGLGNGMLQHGAGLLATSSGRRAGLAADTSLRPRRDGWRGSTSLASERRPRVVWGRLDLGPLELGGGHGAAAEGGSLTRLRLALDGRPGRLAVLLVRRRRLDGLSVAGTWRRDAWSLAAEAATWSDDANDAADGAWNGLAAHVTAVGRTRRWRVEFQAAFARAAAAPAGSQLPACLLTWRGRGWCARTSARTWRGGRVALLLAWSRGRDIDRSLADVRERRRLDASLRGRVAAEGRWRVRLRIDTEREAAWLEDAPWAPPSVSVAAPRASLAVRAEHPAAGGRAVADWRQRHVDGRSRHLLRCGWRREWARWRLRGEVQTAWGDDLDLVSLGVPVGGYYVVQHWGRWRSGAWLGVEGRGRWRWQAAVVVRRPAPPEERPAVEGRVGLRVGF